MPRITRHGGPSITPEQPQSVSPTGVTGTWGEERSDMHATCTQCTTEFAPDLDRCPHCGTDREAEETVTEISGADASHTPGEGGFTDRETDTGKEVEEGCADTPDNDVTPSGGATGDGTERVDDIADPDEPVAVRPDPRGGYVSG